MADQHGAHVPAKMNLTPTPIIPQRGAFSIASHTKPPSTNERNVIQTPTQVKHAMEKVQREMAAIIRDNSPSSATIIPPNSPLTSSKYNKKRIGDKDNKNNITNNTNDIRKLKDQVEKIIEFATS